MTAATERTLIWGYQYVNTGKSVNGGTMGRLKKLELPMERGPKTSKKGSLTIDLDTAEMVRRVQRVDGLSLSELVDRMLQAYIAQTHPDWQMTVESEAAGPFDDLAGEKVSTSVFGGDVTMPDRRDSDRRRKSGLGHAANQRKGSDRRKAKKR